MAEPITTTLDGNAAVAHVAYRVNEICSIYPITPSSTMAELADEGAAQGVANIWGNVPVVQELQSEGGAAGTVHGALQSGALTTTFTASQGLLLMLPNMFKIAGELTPTVFHVAARAIATQALSIFGDHQDVMTTLAQAVAEGQRPLMPRVYGGRYGLSSKDFHPGMAKAVFDEAAQPRVENGFTVGIDDDVCHTSLAFDRHYDIEDPELCIQCGQCSIVCPHSVIAAKYYPEPALAGAPPSFRSAKVNARGFPDSRFTLQVYVEDCTGCGICVESCPAHSPSLPGHRAIDMVDKQPLVAAERENIAFFETLPRPDRARVNFANVRGVQFLESTFEFSGACAGCGETPYLRLLSQLFGDRLQIANATGCSSIFGGNLPAHPWRAGVGGRGPAWSNSLFEDNAEFGLGYRLAIDKQTEIARATLERLAPGVGPELAQQILGARQVTESEFAAQRQRVDRLRAALSERTDEGALTLLTLADFLIRRSVWCVGGDGWAYDIGYGGLDHVLAQGRDVNMLVLDTEVYSNTGGQASKATPLGASAKFAAAGKKVPRKDLAMQAIAYGYVAQIAMGANAEQALIAFREAEAYPGPALILAYSHCIAHGFDLRDGMKQQARATAAGHWPLFRYDPTLRKAGMNPFRLDSPRPRLKLEDFAYRELRYKVLAKASPDSAAAMLRQAGHDEPEAHQRDARADPGEQRALGGEEVFGIGHEVGRRENNGWFGARPLQMQMARASSPSPHLPLAQRLCTPTSEKKTFGDTGPLPGYRARVPSPRPERSSKRHAGGRTH